MYLPRFQTVITTRHVSQIETLTPEGNDQLTQVLHDKAEKALERLALDRQRDRGQEERVHIAEDNSIPPPADHVQGDENSSLELRRSGRQRTKSRRQQEADEALETTSNPDTPDIVRHTAHCNTITHITTVSAVWAGEETCADLPYPKSYKASFEVSDAHLL